MIGSIATRIFSFFCVFLIATTVNSQTKQYYSCMNILTVAGSKEHEPIVSNDTMRISFVPISGKNYKSLIISQKRGIEAMIALPLIKNLKSVSKGNSRKIYYEALNGGKDWTVVVELQSEVVSSVTIQSVLAGQIVQLRYGKLRPLYDD
jgi:hypothetical protein